MSEVQGEATEQSGIPSAPDHSKLISSHYNTIEEKGLDFRNKSPILYLRNFNNWVKAILIGDYLNKTIDSVRHGTPIRVLDLACGKGGDIYKWRNDKVKEVVFADIAKRSIEDCEKRYRDSSKSYAGCRYRAQFIVADLTKQKIRHMYEDPTIKFQLVSCQFAFHYCFESLPQAECMLQNASDCLTSGGYFIGTIPSANYIMKRLKSSGSNSFGNKLCKITFDDPYKETVPLFGAKYHFKLEGVVDCPEFLVHFPTFVKLARRFNLKLIEAKSFKEYFNENVRKGKFLLNRMSGLQAYKKDKSKEETDEENFSDAIKYLAEHEEIDCVGTMSKNEWEAASLYMVFAFEKDPSLNLNSY